MQLPHFPLVNPTAVLPAGFAVISVIPEAPNHTIPNGGARRRSGRGHTIVRGSPTRELHGGNQEASEIGPWGSRDRNVHGHVGRGGSRQSDDRLGDQVSD